MLLRGMLLRGMLLRGRSLVRVLTLAQYRHKVQDFSHVRSCQERACASGSAASSTSPPFDVTDRFSSFLATAKKLLGDNSLETRAYFLANHLLVLELQKDNEKRELELQKDNEKENIEDYFKFHLSFLSQR